MVAETEGNEPREVPGPDVELLRGWMWSGVRQGGAAAAAQGLCAARLSERGGARVAAAVE